MLSYYPAVPHSKQLPIVFHPRRPLATPGSQASDSCLHASFLVMQPLMVISFSWCFSVFTAQLSCLFSSLMAELPPQESLLPLSPVFFGFGDVEAPQGQQQVAMNKLVQSHDAGGSRVSSVGSHSSPLPHHSPASHAPQENLCFLWLQESAWECPQQPTHCMYCFPCWVL